MISTNPAANGSQKERKPMSKSTTMPRVIEWFKNADMEEVTYVMHRAGNIIQARKAQVENADAHGKVKRTRRARRQADSPVQDGTHTGEVNAATA